LFLFLFVRPRLGLLVLCLLAALSASCRDLDRFDTKGDPAFCGEMVLGPLFNDGFLREGRDPPSLMLELDTSQLAYLGGDKPSRPGTLSSNDKDGICVDQPLFMGAQMRTIPQVYHDTLSTLSFGEGHDDDFFAWVDSSCQGTMLALVSLLRNGHVEVRMFKPAAFSDDPLITNDKKPGYAVFYLDRNEQGCEGFSER
jgi:hypothetical protein